MNTTEPTLKKTEVMLMIGLALVAMALITVVVIPDFRVKVKNTFQGSGREVMAKVSGRLTGEGPFVTVLKIKSGNSMSLEVFKKEEDGSSVLMTKIPLYEVRDGHFFLQGNATNLALTDVDRDGNLEIVSPTYDEQMVPRLNIYRYNPGTQSFDRLTAPQEFEP